MIDYDNPKPFSTGYLPEHQGHQIYYAQYGNKNGETIIVSHGGPGSKSKSRHVKSFDLSKYRVVQFDQRGCGKSLPQGETKHNTTSDLISDMERLRETIGVSEWYVAGASWGSTLSLLYAEAHPNRVKGLMISSIFLGRKKDVEWSFTKAGGVERMFADLWDHRVNFLQKFGATPANAAQILLEKINSVEESEQKQIAAGVMNWEGNLMTAQSDIQITEPEDVTESDINEVKIFLHYDKNNSFIEEDQILKNISSIKNIPTIIVHGRHDVLCTIGQMWELCNKLSNVEYVILPTSNHKLTADGDIAKRYAYRYFLAKQEK